MLYPAFVCDTGRRLWFPISHYTQDTDIYINNRKRRYTALASQICNGLHHSHHSLGPLLRASIQDNRNKIRCKKSGPIRSNVCKWHQTRVFARLCVPMCHTAAHWNIPVESMLERMSVQKVDGWKRANKINRFAGHAASVVVALCS